MLNSFVSSIKQASLPVLAFLLFVLVAQSYAFTSSGLLEIHQINVQQGDCTLLVGPDGTTILIDGGKPGKGIDEIVPYLQSIDFQPADGLDYIILTHRDGDHLGGLDEVINAGYDVKTGVWDNGSDKTDSPNQHEISDFLSASNGTMAGEVMAAPLGAAILLGDGATARIVAVGGHVLGVGEVIADPSENDQCVAVLVKYGKFEYLVAGDLGGGEDDHACTGRKTDQDNLETPLAESLVSENSAGLLGTDGLEVLHVNHHGSESSTNSQFMNLLSPRVAVINTGADQGSNYNHPRKDVVENVLSAQADCITAPAALVLQTEEGRPFGENSSEAGFACGDIIIKTDGWSSFSVVGNGAVSQGPDERVDAGVDSEAVFPLDGQSAAPVAQLVISEFMADPQDVSDAQGEWVEIFNRGSESVDIDGWTLRDDDLDNHTIENNGPLLVPGGGALVLARFDDPTGNGGFEPDYTYNGFFLANSIDEIILEDADGNIVDEVRYLGQPEWPINRGASAVLNNPEANNAYGNNWSVATERGEKFSGTEGDLGTPGEDSDHE